MIHTTNDPLKEALQGDRLISQDVIFGKVAIWVLKLATVGTTGVFTWSLLSNSLPKDASTIMVAFAGIGAFMLEVCFLLATIWIKISRNGLQTALAWSIFAFSLLFLLVNVIAGAILSESKQATLGRGWIDLYLVIMPATGVLCAVLVVLWSLASPEASAARRSSIAAGLVAQRYETARLRTALHDVALGEVVDQAASRDAWQAVSRNLGLPTTPVAALPAAQPVSQTPLATIPTMNMPTLPTAQATEQPAQYQEVELEKLLKLPAIQQLVQAYFQGTIEVTPKKQQEPTQPARPAIATFAADSGSDIPPAETEKNS